MMMFGRNVKVACIITKKKGVREGGSLCAHDILLNWMVDIITCVEAVSE